MKITYLTNTINTKNGWGRYASDLIYGIKDAGNDIDILKEEDDGFEGSHLLKRGWGILSSAFKIRNLIRNCDIIHALDGYPYGIIAWLANIGLRKKLVISVVGTYGVAPLHNWKTCLLLKQAYKKADSVITISDYTRDEILKKVNVSNIRVINPSVDLKKFNTEHAESRDNFILSVGSLKFRKGYHISIPAFSLARKSIPNLKYKIVGSQSDKTYFKYLKKIVKEENIEHDVEFLDNVSDDELIKLYQSAKLFILTSVNHDHHFEGFGLVFLEAAAARLPVIGTKNNGIKSAVSDGHNAILVNQNSIVDTVKAITSILEDENKRSTMGRLSYEWAQKNNINSMIKQYLMIYKNI